jgi:hypothetical protein
VRSFFVRLGDDQPLSLAGFYRCRTLLAFPQSIKPNKANRAIWTVEMRWLTGCEHCAVEVDQNRINSQARKTIIAAKEF